MSDTAVEKVKELIISQNREGSGLRVYVAGGGCSGFRYGMALDDSPGDEDFIHEFGDLKVYIDPQSSPYLEGASVDYVESAMGAGFKVDNPNAVSTCGCGSSFKTADGEPVGSEHTAAH